MSDGARWDLVHATHGIASLRHTHWLDDDAREYEGAPGRWWAVDDRVHGTDVNGPGDIELAPFESVLVGDLKLSAFARDGALALRVYDPQNPARLDLEKIQSFDQDPAWVLPGRFDAAPEGTQRLVRSVDGYESPQTATGRVAVTVAGQHLHLVVSGGQAGLSAVFADATAAEGAYPFRFLTIDAPDAEGRVVVDFNRAYLPPCAFSDQYVCPLPAPENRIAVAVRAGEERVVRR